MGKDFHLMFFEYSQLLPKFSPVQKGILRLQHSLENLNIDISTPSFKNFFRNHLLQLNNSDDLSTTLLTDTSPHPCSTGLVSRITFHFFLFFFPLEPPFLLFFFRTYRIRRIDPEFLSFLASTSIEWAANVSFESDC